MSQFSTNESVSLEKEINIKINEPTKSEFIDDVYEIKRCVDWIKCNNYHKVCLQFPDYLLPDSSEVALRLGRKSGENVYILADTAYESCCIDYVAAAHVNADAIIHYGPVCFSPTSANIPYLNIYEKNPFNFEEFQRVFSEKFENSDEITILLDTPFVYLQNEFQTRFTNTTIKSTVSSDLDVINSIVVFIGGRNLHRMLPNLKFSLKPKSLYYYDSDGPCLINYEQDVKILKRRYFLIEKIKDSNTIGIVIGTLGVKNYLKAIERIKTLINLHKKKYYMISVGKPTVAKLANFPEIDIYVIVTCALNEIYDNRDYYKPIVTIYDIEMALNPSEDLNFTYDYNDVTSRPIGEIKNNDSDVSLISGGIRGNCNVAIDKTNEIMTKEGGIVALNSTYGAGFLAERTWKGLEQKLGESEIKMAEEGRRGIAQQYNEEPAF